MRLLEFLVYLVCTAHISVSVKTHHRSRVHSDREPPVSQRSVFPNSAVHTDDQALEVLKNNHEQRLLRFVRELKALQPLDYEYKKIPREHETSKNETSSPNMVEPVDMNTANASMKYNPKSKAAYPNIPCDRVEPPTDFSYIQNKSFDINKDHLLKDRDGTDLYLLWNSGVDALGNAMLGYLTTYWDAMRSGRRLVASRYGMIQMLGETFDLGIEFVPKEFDADYSNPSTHSEICPNILFDYAQLGKEKPIVYRHGGNGNYMAGGKVACSRIKNFHFDRPPPPLIGCYFQKLGCLKQPRDSINPAKQGDTFKDACAEKGALRQLFLGPSQKLLELAPHFESHWAGSQERLHQLFFKTRNAKQPIWDAALHLRVQFSFVESGKDERDAGAVTEVEAWLAEAETKTKLQKLVNGLRNRKCVYVASETALVRRHVADMIRALGVEADYFMLSGVSHPVGKNKGRHYSVKDLHDDEMRAHSIFPYLEWWALAHSKQIIVHRHKTLSTAPSTYSGSAHLYGGWV